MRGRGLLERFGERGLLALFAVVFVALAAPAVVLVAQAYSQLKLEAFRATQLAAEELAARIDAQLRAATAAEEARSFGDYSFLVVEGDAAANFVQRSPLSAFPVVSAVPGVLGYFQVDAAGRLTTPLLPEAGVAAASYGIAADEEAARAALVAELREVLAQNRLLRPQARLDAVAAPAAESQRRAAQPVRDSAIPSSDLEAAAIAAAAPALGAEAAAVPAAAAPAEEQAQAAFDRLATGVRSFARAPSASLGDEAVGAASLSVADDAATANEAVHEAVEARAEPGADDRQKRVEQTLVPEAEIAVTAVENDAAPVPKVELRVRTFESEVDPFEVGALDTGHFVLFRNVWRDGQRYVQGALVDRAGFFAGAVEGPYGTSSVAQGSDLAVTFQGRTLATLSAVAAPVYSAAPREFAGTLLHRTRLSPPFGDLELAFNVNALPRAPGTALLAWVSVTLAVVLCGGFLLMYRFAAGQMRLARQQQDFVSAVSHELKTPLTSIRMYGEMLKAGWADEAKKQTYYEYIHGESERLSRLIDNVLQLARLTRSSQRFDMKSVGVTELIDMVRSKVATQVERARFELRVRNDAPAAVAIVVDVDCFTQIFINLVDNALKFAAAADTKVVEIACRRESDGTVLFTVRDYGPGVPKTRMKRIFELFYRAESELTRETVGTGIGLALVRQLAAAMGARIDVRNCDPGAEFRLRFAP
jgi:signal transduction histidine kinase